MATTKPKAQPRTKLAERTPILEWIAAGAGLILTLSVVVYLVREGVTDKPGPPVLTVTASSAVQSEAGYVVPVTVHNAADETASDVEVAGVLQSPGAAPEERRATFTYVPGKGSAKGGLVFQGDPARGRVTYAAVGYSEP